MLFNEADPFVMKKTSCEDGTKCPLSVSQFENARKDGKWRYDVHLCKRPQHDKDCYST
jgi:hypothetical protein